AQQFIELALSRVAEGRVPDVVHQGQSFGEISVELQRSGDGARDLRDLQRVREPVAEMVGIPRGEDLCFCFEPAERPRMNHAVAVARVDVAVRVRRLGITPAARFPRIHRIGSKCHGTILCHVVSDAKSLQLPKLEMIRTSLFRTSEVSATTTRTVREGPSTPEASGVEAMTS